MREDLIRQIRAYTPYNEQEETDQKTILRMLQEQEEFLKSLDEHFGTFTNDGNPVEVIPTLEELLDSFVMPTIPEDNPGADALPQTGDGWIGHYGRYPGTLSRPACGRSG